MTTHCSALTVFAFGLVFAHGAARGSDADLDPTFGVGGLALAGLTDVYGSVSSPVVQPDGKILICDTRSDNGTSGDDFVVARFNANGTLDTSFNFNGLVTIDFDGGAGWDDCAGIALQSDGKIVVAGSTYSPTPNGIDFAVARLNVDGTLDPTFGTGTGKVRIGFDLAGGQSDQAHAVAIQADGKIVVAGSAETASNGTDFAAVRLLPDGSRDTAFNLTGKVTFGFDFPGSSRNDAAFAVAIDGSGRIVLGGIADRSNTWPPSQDFALARLLPNGQLDPNFNADGRVTVAFDLGASGDDQLSAMMIQPDGRIVVAGAADTSPTSTPNYDMAIARVLPNGALDNGFGIGGRTLVAFDRFASSYNGVLGVARQDDGKLILAGAAADIGYVEILGATARLNPDGSLDHGFGTFGKQTYDFGLSAPTGQLLRGIAFQGTQVVISGATRLALGPDLGADSFVLRLGSDRIFAGGFE